jgi:hypothetical protein
VDHLLHALLATAVTLTTIASAEELRLLVLLALWLRLPCVIVCQGRS